MALTVQACGPIHCCVLGSLVLMPAVTVNSLPSCCPAFCGTFLCGQWSVQVLNFVVSYVQSCIYVCIYIHIHTTYIHTYSTEYTRARAGRLLLIFLKTVLYRYKSDSEISSFTCLLKTRRDKNENASNY